MTVSQVGNVRQPRSRIDDASDISHDSSLTNEPTFSNYNDDNNKPIQVDEEALNFRLLSFQNQMDLMHKFDEIVCPTVKRSSPTTSSNNKVEIQEIPPERHVMFSTSEDVIIGDMTEGTEDSDSCLCSKQNEDLNFQNCNEPIYNTIADSSPANSPRSPRSLSDYEFIIGVNPNANDPFPSTLPQLHPPSVKTCLRYSANIRSLSDSDYDGEECSDTRQSVVSSDRSGDDAENNSGKFAVAQYTAWTSIHVAFLTPYISSSISLLSTLLC